ncbi:metallophosphoesterase family protein [Sulfitobacter guttiformis]|uniref:Calcineurin-like phosphoesterase family protein n=1 Tax=Sulfitobacter guttiformis TaxID=74349 RepID=A0A420DIC9_9RHOB|nr:metallophosphoesterase family protein [Sulfitobacter guttiformis]RKE93980.1 calcineurin-like phosphoesterase family protein [Sulfitobacter guttiformis]
MKHRDLGVLDGDVLLFGGPYSNLQATQAVLAQARLRGIAADHVICTGDIVAYCGAPLSCVAAVRASGCAVLAGNCEMQLAQSAADCGCGFEEGTTCDRLSVAWYAFAQSQLGAADRTWMAGLPDTLSFVHHGKRYGVLHGGVRDIARFIWETDTAEVFEAEWTALEAVTGPLDGVIAGHSGLPFMRQTARGQWMNAGVIGMPPHDGAAQTRFAQMRNGAFSIETLDYDAAAAAADMDAAHLPADYRDALLRGYWPSEDVLPSALRIADADRG